MRIVSIGEILWDVFEEAEHLGGAVFNLSAHLAQLGHEVAFVSAVGDDDRGVRALDRAWSLGLADRYIGRVAVAGRGGATAETGIVTVTLDAGGQPSYVIHRPAAYDFADLSAEEIGQLASSGPEWLCLGTLYQTQPGGYALTRRLLEAMPGVPRFYDVNLRRDSFTPELVDELLGVADVVKLNDEEVIEIGRMLDLPAGSPEEFCRRNAQRYHWRTVCVTRGRDGCSLLADSDYVEVPGYPVVVADTVGAGDAFSAGLVHGLGAGWPARQTADFANRVGAFVASRAGGTPLWTIEELNDELPSRLA